MVIREKKKIKYVKEFDIKVRIRFNRETIIKKI